MLARTATGFSRAFALLCITAAGGLIGANLAAVLSGPFVFDLQGEQFAQCLHGGWIAGAALFLFGALTKRLRVISSSLIGLTPDPPKETQRTPNDPSPTGVEAVRRRRRVIRLREGRPVGVPLGIALGAVAGSILGGLLGGTLLLLWFSFTYSPFAPVGWASSVRIERQPTRNTLRRERPASTTQHPVARALFFGPAALGAMAGAVFGGVGAAKGRFHIE
jgi:hypothetical protein